MANLITSTRFVLLFFLVASIYVAPPAWQLANPILLIVIIVLDGADGYVARQRGETSLFGAVYDVAVDRIVENVLWIALADLDLVPVWVALLFITRGVLVDTIRSHAASQGQTAFDEMSTGWGRTLVAGRFMRAFYGTVKAVAFAWILAFQPAATLFPVFWSQWAGFVDWTTTLLIYIAVATCLLRALPVLWAFYRAQFPVGKADSLEGGQ